MITATVDNPRYRSKIRAIGFAEKTPLILIGLKVEHEDIDDEAIHLVPYWLRN
jgi:hypothetical protein